MFGFFKRLFSNPAPAPVAAPVPQPPAPAATPVVPAAPLPSPAAPPPARPVSAAGVLTVKLSAVYAFWPEPVRQDIANAGGNEASVSLPMDRLDSALRTGRVVFTWGELIQWLDGSAAAIPSSHRETILELPLKIIAPLFMAQRQPLANQTKIVVGDNIPNLFAQPGQSPAPITPKPAPAVAPVPVVAPAPTPTPVVASPAPAPVVVAPAVAAPANSLGEILGQPDKKEWSPQEITQKINALPGVAGSLMVMSDGLLVAGELPPPLKSETLAAFVPQMFGRMSHYSGEIHLGTPVTSLSLLAGQNALAILKSGGHYLAVLGKAGEPLPEAQLQRLAAELAKRSQ